MTNLDTITIEKLDLTEVKSTLQDLFNALKSSKDYSEFRKILSDIHKLITKLLSNSRLAGYKFYGNTTSAEWKELNDYYTELWSKLSGEFSEIEKFIGNSQFLDKIKEDFGWNKYSEYKNATFTINEKAQDLLQKESKISDDIMTFKAQAKVDWNGAEISFSRLNIYTIDSDRAVRKKALDMQSEFYLKNESFFNEKLISIVNIRNEFARELGFKNYVEYSLLKWNRIGYNYQDLKVYRDFVSKYFKEVFLKINEFKKSSLSLDTVTYYDTILFPDGLAKLTTPDSKSSIEKFDTLLGKLNPNWQKVYQSMLTNHSIDYESRENKAEIGFANYIHEYKTPIIYSVFHNISNDIRVLSHEFGHALQFHTSWSDDADSLMSNFTLDTVEIFSHSMEMFCFPYMDEFFGKDAYKYKIEDFFGHLRIINSTCQGDEFQEIIYSQENLTAEFIEKTYQELGKKYQGNYTDVSENEFFGNGKNWKSIDHFFHSPFYLIDYSLAAINALNLYRIYQSDADKAMHIWETMAQNIKNLNYQNIKKIAPEAVHPFVENEIKQVAEFAFKELDELFKVKDA